MSAADMPRSIQGVIDNPEPDADLVSRMAELATDALVEEAVEPLEGIRAWEVATQAVLYIEATAQEKTEAVRKAVDQYITGLI